MTILIPLTTSHNNDTELKFCLRGVEKHCTGIEKIILVGEKPDWIRDVQHIKAKDLPGQRNKEYNIFSKIKAGIPYAGERFLFMNDDHFLLQDFADFPYHHKGPLADCIKATSNHNPYRHTLRSTARLLGAVNNYDTHCPIIYESERFLKTMPDKFPPFGYGIKTLYCVKNGIDGTYYPDLKMGKTVQDITGRAYFSTGILSAEVLALLESLYPVKSGWEG